MSILSKKNFFVRLSDSRLTREAPRTEAASNGTPSIVINDKEEHEEIWMSEIDGGSISSESSSDSVTCHIPTAPMTQEQPWSAKEVEAALLNLPGGEVAISLIPSLQDDTLQKALEEFKCLALNKTKLDCRHRKLSLPTFANGFMRKALLNSENGAAAATTPGQLLAGWPDTCLLASSWLGHVEVARALLDKGAPVSTSDYDGRTPLHLAACTASVKLVEELLKHGADPHKWDLGKKCTPLHCAAAAGCVATVKCLIKSGANVDAGLSGKSPLHYAVLNNAGDCVEALLQAGLHRDTAARGGYLGQRMLYETVIESRSRCESATGSRKVNTSTPGSRRRQRGVHQVIAECWCGLGSEEFARSDGNAPGSACSICRNVRPVNKRRCESQRRGRRRANSSTCRSCKSSKEWRTGQDFNTSASVNKADKFGYTPLHTAALNESSPTVVILLSKGADVTARTKGGVTALSFIIRRTPDVLPRFVARFDQAISLHDHELGDVDCELRLDYRPLVPGGRGETDLMLCLVEVGQGHVLKHPLCESFLYLKWLRIRKFFLLSLMFHSIFVALFTGYVGATYRWQVKRLSNVLLWPVLGFTCVLACKELFQVAHGICCYARRWENWLQWSVIMASGIILIPSAYTWQHHVAALGVLLVWIELMMVVGRFPMFGIYVQMFTQVSINFFKFLAAYVCLIVGFSLGFSVLHKNYKSFANPLVSLLKTVIMMSGELEFEDVFFDDEAPLQYPGTAHLMLLGFVILVTVILTNLMVGLAVSDIQELRRCAGLDRLVRRAELVAHLESMLFSKLLDHAPARRIIRACRRGALLLHPPYHCALHIRPNDPREKRLPRELVRAIYRLVSERKTRRATFRGGAPPLPRNVNATVADSSHARVSRMYSNESNQLQLNELAAEMKRYSYNVSKRLDNLTDKVESIARDLNVSTHLH
ncbi:PREDICTED: transient receptor potential channel pyrexia-like isoform X2 [Vollenhovia emeryi]|uniref:transient receptor potential channel pyrexia-like isoform X2 n=1 Tax=Vollenhovia emeryi TaxID=411798 RepID=UPI0005F4020C|nr:PREDICTED: transient receptor potential channel pyrexia-like isoform X2 [Vollenhovia emeryi]